MKKPYDGRLTNMLRPFFHKRGDPIKMYVSDSNVSNPPTDAQLDSAFGNPSDLATDTMYVVDDNGAGTTFWLCFTDGLSWMYLGPFSVAV